ncbi:MAG: hypothetical protein LBO63_06425 [Oscillospiraceae bacterium]|jgi:hypothetical protein|nr:hypothetical protein [Oscillospiraceae bacterium]
MSAEIIKAQREDYPALRFIGTPTPRRANGFRSSGTTVRTIPRRTGRAHAF